jgi:hypothetical protein
MIILALIKMYIPRVNIKMSDIRVKHQRPSCLLSLNLQIHGQIEPGVIQ